MAGKTFSKKRLGNSKHPHLEEDSQICLPQNGTFQGFAFGQGGLSKVLLSRTPRLFRFCLDTHGLANELLPSGI